MKPTARILVGDVRKKLAELPDASVHCVGTSPPYWGLRDYGVDGQIGLEETPEIFIDALVEVFSEAKRLLRPDGTLWVNMGDCYAGAPAGNAPQDLSHGEPTGTRGQQPGKAARFNQGLNSSPKRDAAGASSPASRRRGKIGDKSTLEGSQTSQEASREGRAASARNFGAAKPKDLVGQPWMLAFALRDRLGLYLRNEIIWNKRSVMPESCRDRLTRDHEQVFLFAKSETYFYDADAIREEGAIPAGTRAAKGSDKRAAEDGVNARPAEYAVYSGTRNKRTVWTLGPESSGEDHFATFPTKLVEPWILAGTSERGCCSACGAPWWRVKTKASGGAIGKSWRDHANDAEEGNFKTQSSEGYTPARTVGWEPSCECSRSLEPVPCTVLDPFSGTGTTGVVALKFGRSYIGVELNPKYAEISERRLRVADEEFGAPLFDTARASP